MVSLNSTSLFLNLGILLANSYSLSGSAFEGILGLGQNQGDFDLVAKLKDAGHINRKIFAIALKSLSESRGSAIQFGTHSTVQDDALIWHPVAQAGRWGVNLDQIEYNGGTISSSQFSGIHADIDTGSTVLAFKRSLYNLLLPIL